MSDSRAYELHAYSGGRWKIQGFFDDQELAVAEARRMDSTRRFPAVRVVEERYDPGDGSYHSRTVFRSSPVEQHNEQALKQRAETRRTVEDERARHRRTEAEGRPAKTGGASPALSMIALKAVLLAVLGVAAYWALNHYVQP
jgi:hypothetical protein